MGHSITDLQRFLTTIEGVPFGQNITPFPSQKQLTRLPTFAVSQETPPPHIPRFLPVFPDPHARFESPEYAKGPDSSHARQQQLVQQQQEGEEALLRIEARQAPPDGALQQAARGFQEPEETKGQAEAEVNPFFAPILWEAPAARGVEGGSYVKNVEAPSKKPLDWMEAETLNPPTMQYHGWQWTNSLAEQASLARSGRWAIISTVFAECSRRVSSLKDYFLLQGTSSGCLCRRSWRRRSCWDDTSSACYIHQ